MKLQIIYLAMLSLPIEGMRWLSTQRAEQQAAGGACGSDWLHRLLSVTLCATLQRKAGGGKLLSSGENHMKYSDDEGDGMGMHDDMDDLDGGTPIAVANPSPLLLYYMYFVPGTALYNDLQYHTANVNPLRQPLSGRRLRLRRS